MEVEAPRQQPEHPGQDAERVKTRKKRSFVWASFREDTTSQKPAGVTRIVLCQIEGCTEPKLELKDHSTALMISHLKKHGMVSIFIKISHFLGLVEASPNKDAKIVLPKGKQDEIDLYLYVHLFECFLLISRVKFVATSHTPICIVENQEFKDFCGSLNAAYSVPSRPLLRDMILQEAQHIRDRVCFVLMIYSSHILAQFLRCTSTLEQLITHLTAWISGKVPPGYAHCICCYC